MRLVVTRFYKGWEVNIFLLIKLDGNCKNVRNFFGSLFCCMKQQKVLNKKSEAFLKLIDVVILQLRSLWLCCTKKTVQVALKPFFINIYCVTDKKASTCKKVLYLSISMISY
ncbi:hypothetical protein ACKWTF_006981 [Chironomus riparius]